MAQYINEIPPYIYTGLKQIGSGGYSTIFSAIHVQTQVKVALKMTMKNDEDKMKVTFQESTIHKLLNHPFICKYYTDFETEHLKVTVMELVEGISLLEYVNSKNGLPIREVQNIFSQIIIAIEYLHVEQNISHRDLKLENIMVDNYGHIRLIDFGFSTQKDLMSTMIGSVPYCAPELIKNENYTKESDLWSLGIILYALASGNLPFYHSNMATMAYMIVNLNPQYPSNFPPLLHDLISRLLQKDPSQRIQIDEIKNHPFLVHARIFQIDYKRLFRPNQMSPPHQRKRRRTKSFIPSSQSDPDIMKNVSELSIRNNSISSSQSMVNPLMFSKLQLSITCNSQNVDDLIISRKDFALNLDKVLEASFLELRPTANESSPIINSGRIKLRSSLPSQLQISTGNRYVTKSPLIARPVKY